MNTKKEKNKLNIAMAGGGTGGHVFPIQSLIQHLCFHDKYSQNIEKIYRFGSKNSLEEKTCSAQAEKCTNLSFIPVISGKYRRETPILSRLKNVRDGLFFVFGIFQAIYLLYKYHIDVIFCKGGYVALPVVIAGWILRKRIIIHESDTHSGLTNKIAARFANKIFTGFDGVFPQSETLGQILSDDMAYSFRDKNFEIKNMLKRIDKKKTIVLVIGGSQGSYRLYKSLLRLLETNSDDVYDFVFFVSLGVLNNDLKQDFERFENVFVFDFLSQKEMGAICHYADIGLTRAGTTSLAEQKLYDMKLFIVPIAWTHDQYDNAKYYVQQHKDLLIDQRDPDFEEHLAQAFRQNVGYHKTHVDKDIPRLIAIAKDRIATAIIE